jgi:hypothetical protein
MSVPDETPQYLVLQDTFFAPKMVLAGSKVATHASPGPHLQPLNAAAKARMEDWYNEEHPTLDKNGDPDPTRTYKPHAIYRYAELAEVEQHQMHVLAEPGRDAPSDLSLAQSLYAGKTDTDQRPGPAMLPGLEPVPEAEAVRAQSGAEVVEDNKTPADPRKAGIKVS